MGDFWRCVKANGFWTTLKMIDSKEFRAELYEAAQENYIVSLIVACNTELELTETQQWAYILDKERLGHSEEFVKQLKLYMNTRMTQRTRKNAIRIGKTTNNG